MTIKELLESKKTFYTKRLQFNGYYPIDKFVWDDELGAYRMFASKHKDWGSHYGDNKSLEFVLTHNSFLISLDEFADSKHYNSEGFRTINID